MALPKKSEIEKILDYVEETKKSIERIAKNFEYYLAQGVTNFNHY